MEIISTENTDCRGRIRNHETQERAIRPPEPAIPVTIEIFENGFKIITCPSKRGNNCKHGGRCIHL